MATLLRVRTVITGSFGAPGLGTHYFNDSGASLSTEATDAVGRVRAFWAAYAAFFPTAVLFQVSGNVDTILDTTGALSGGTSVASPSVLPGTGGTAQMSPAVQILHRHQTGAVVGGHRLQGHTNVGPLVNAAANTSGAPATAVGTASGVAAAALLTGATSIGPVVWHRPKSPNPGSSFAIVGGSAAPFFAILRSRRD